MATSEAEALLRFRPNNYTANHPASVHMTRTLVNNANHLADEDAQVCVCSDASKSVLVGTDWTTVGVWGVFPLKISGGTPYPVRVRARMRLSAASNTQIIVGLVPPGRVSDLFGGNGNVKATNPALGYATISNTSAAWVTLAYPSGIANMLYGGREFVDEGEQRFSVPTTVGGAKTSDVKVALGQLVVVARKVAAGTLTVYCDALYGAQYVGLE